MSGKKMLYIGLAVSICMHGALFQSFFAMSRMPQKKIYSKSTLVEFEVKKPEIKKEEVKKEEIKPVIKKVVKLDKPVDQPPVSHDRTEPKEPPKEEVKPVFGVTADTVADNSAGIAVRVGNTLMKEQEKEFADPAKVKNYQGGAKLEERQEKKVAPVPSYELSSLPVYKNRIKPLYPAALKDDELEGEVLLLVTIDEEGRVRDVKVKRTDHQLFADAAIKAMKETRFAPAIRNGQPVATAIDIPVKFVLDI